MVLPDLRKGSFGGEADNYVPANRVHTLPVCVLLLSRGLLLRA